MRRPRGSKASVSRAKWTKKKRLTRVFMSHCIFLKNITKTVVYNRPHRIAHAIDVIRCKNSRYIDMPRTLKFITESRVLQSFCNSWAISHNSSWIVKSKTSLAGAKLSIFKLFLFPPQGLQDLSSPTRDWTRAHSSESASPNHWTVREFLRHALIF